jgi:hypothetical protein
MLFYSNYEHALSWSQSSLDWCSGPDSSCVGFSRAYRICPADFGKTLPQATIAVGMQVHSHGGASDALGWIMRLPSKKKKGYHVRHTDGITETMNEGDVEKFVVPKCSVGDVGDS